MKNLRKITIGIILIALLIALIPNNVKAAVGSFSLNKNSASLEIGGTTTVTVNIANCEGKFTVSSSNTSVATVNTSSFWGDEKGTTITITAKSAGTANINITAVDVTDTDINDVTGTRTCKITVTAPQPPETKPEPEPEPEVKPEPEKPTTTTPSTNTGSSGNTGTTQKPSTGTTTSKPSTSTTTTQKPTVVEKKSDNSKLGSLQIAEGAITPEFSSGTKEYSISVPNEVTKLNITATADHSKATVKITGNEELQIGDNNIEIVVTAEDGSKTTYKILVKRAQPALSLQALTVAYIDENGERVELILNPVFSFDIYDYIIDTIIPHTIKNLEVLGTANRENAVIEIIGHEELKSGENEITIKASVTDGAGLVEEKVYKIKVQREEEPVVTPVSTIGKIKDWFIGIGSTMSSWFTENFNKITTGMLLIVTFTLIGLTIYCICFYKKHQKLLEKLAEFNKANLMERANIALDPEAVKNIPQVENIETVEKQENNIIEEITDKREAKAGKGKRFK